jgi:hypothetical protein
MHIQNKNSVNKIFVLFHFDAAPRKMSAIRIERWIWIRIRKIKILNLTNAEHC